MNEESIASFVEDEGTRIHSQGALNHRYRDLMTFYRWLPEDKEIAKERLTQWNCAPFIQQSASQPLCRR